MSDDRPTFGSLFSGIGGFDLGLERAGWRCAWQVEKDDHCQAVLRRRFGSRDSRTEGRGATGDERQRDVQLASSGEWREQSPIASPPVLHGDVRHVNLPPVDLVCGGFPCTDLSVAGRRAGLAGDESGLWFEFRRIVAELAPRWVLVENVPGLFSSNHGEDFATVLAGLVELGYGVAWRVLNAQHFGVAQRRRRVFVVGHLGEPWSAAASVLFEPESCERDSASRGTSGAWVAPTLESGANGTGGTRPPGSTVDTADTLVVSTLQGGGKRGHRVDAETAAGGLGRLMSGADDNDAQGNRLVVMPTLTSRCGNTQDDQQSTQLVVGVTHSLRSEGADASEDGTGRGTPLVVAPISGGNYGSGNTDEGVPNLVMEPTVRRLTPLECERLQGFPDGWTAGQSDSSRYRQLGNAVAVPVIEWIARRLVAVDEALSTRELAG